MDTKIYSKDKNFYYEIVTKNNLYRIHYFLNTSDEKDTPNYTPICGTNASLFDDIELTQKEANRILKKYEDNPNLFR